MATVNWQKATASDCKLRSAEGCLVVDQFVDGDNTVLLTLPIEDLERLCVLTQPTDRLTLTDKHVEYDAGTLTITE